MNLVQHLKERHLDFALHRPMLDEEAGVATFLLWNLSGRPVGYQQYRPLGDKKLPNNKEAGKYFTFTTLGELAVWGVESLYLSPSVLFVVEGVFDAARLTERGYSAVAVLANDRPLELRDWLMSLNRLVVVVADDDKAGKYLMKFGHVAVLTDAHDLGDASDKFVDDLLARFG